MRLKNLCLPGQRPFATLRVTACRVSFHQKCASRCWFTQHEVSTKRAVSPLFGAESALDQLLAEEAAGLPLRDVVVHCRHVDALERIADQAQQDHDQDHHLHQVDVQLDQKARRHFHLQPIDALRDQPADASRPDSSERA